MSIVHYFHVVVSSRQATVAVIHPSVVSTAVATMGSGASVLQGGRSRLITNVIFVHTTEVLQSESDYDMDIEPIDSDEVEIDYDYDYQTERTDADIERVANEWDRN